MSGTEQRMWLGVRGAGAASPRCEEGRDIEHWDVEMPALEPREDLEPRARTRNAEPSAVAPAIPPFAELYREHFDFVWRSLRHLGVPPPAMDDAAQEVWLAVHRKLSSFEGRARPSTWLFGIAHNVARSQRRRLHAARAGELSEELPSRSPDPEHMLAGHDAWALVLGYLETLDELPRAIFVSALLENLTPAETAEAIGIDVDVVYRRVRALRRAFQRRLRQREEIK